MPKEERELKILKKAFSKACELLDDLTGKGHLICPMEYLERCECDSGFECSNANWEFAILEKIKEEEQLKNWLKYYEKWNSEKDI